MINWFVISIESQLKDIVERLILITDYIFPLGVTVKIKYG